MLCAVCCVLTFGCVRQQLAIRSEPPGAELLLNDQPIGTTPCTHDFLWYGWHRVILTKPGYEELNERVLINSPWYLWMPLDLVMELWPGTVRDTRELSFQLEPEVPIPAPSRPVLDSQADHEKRSTHATGGT